MRHLPRPARPFEPWRWIGDLHASRLEKRDHSLRHSDHRPNVARTHDDGRSLTACQEATALMTTSPCERLAVRLLVDQQRCRGVEFRYRPAASSALAHDPLLGCHHRALQSGRMGNTATARGGLPGSGYPTFKNDRGVWKSASMIASSAPHSHVRRPVTLRSRKGDPFPGRLSLNFRDIPAQNLNRGRREVPFGHYGSDRLAVHSCFGQKTFLPDTLIVAAAQLADIERCRLGGQPLGPLLCARSGRSTTTR